jgi:hypothetical protein
MTKVWVSQKWDKYWLEPSPGMLFAEDRGGKLPEDEDFTLGPLMLTEPGQGPGQISPGGAAYFWVRYDPRIPGVEPSGAMRMQVRAAGMTIGERPRLLVRIWYALRRLVRRTR